MSNDLIRGLIDALGPRAMKNLANPIGSEPNATEDAVQAALPILLGALARNANDTNGASDLLGAIERDHSQLELADVLGSVSAGGGDGQAILRHVLGARQSAAAEGVSRASGLGRGQALQLLTMLAPLVLNYLGKRARQRGMGAPDLGGMLGEQSRQAESGNGALGGLVSAVLDRDRDGDVDFADIIGAAGALSRRGGPSLGSRA
jgi:hypothetical protein